MIYGFDDDKNKVEFIKVLEKRGQTHSITFTIEPLLIGEKSGSKISDWRVLMAYEIYKKFNIRNVLIEETVDNKDFTTYIDHEHNKMYVTFPMDTAGNWARIVLTKSDRETHIVDI